MEHLPNNILKINELSMALFDSTTPERWKYWWIPHWVLLVNYVTFTSLFTKAKAKIYCLWCSFHLLDFSGFLQDFFSQWENLGEGE